MAIELAIIIVGFLALMAIGMPIAFSFTVTAIIGLLAFGGGVNALDAIGLVAWSANNSFVLTAVPLFVFAGEILLRAGFSKELYDVTSRWASGIPGALAVGTIGSCAIFSAASGSSVATAATIGVIAIPELEKRGYDKKLVYGTLAAGGTLGILIPPSITMIIYGAFTATSVGKLFLAGVFPGLLLAGLFSVYIIMRAVINPAVAPRIAGSNWKDRLTSLPKIWPIVVLIVIILGGIYSGISTPTEAGGVGAFVAIVLGIAMRRLKWRDLSGASHDAMRTTCMLLFIVTAALFLGNLLTALRIPEQIVAAVSALPVSRYLLLAIITLAYIIMGMVIESLSMMVMTLPVVAPVMSALGFDLIWFGIFMVVLVEMALLTPPVALNLYVIHGIARGSTMNEVIKGTIPFLAVQVLLLVILTIFPQIALWLPGLMIGKG